MAAPRFPESAELHLQPAGFSAERERRQAGAWVKSSAFTVSSSGSVRGYPWTSQGQNVVLLDDVGASTLSVAGQL